MATFFKDILYMAFPERLTLLRKQSKYTQQKLADAISINVSQLKRYEAGTSQPTLEVLRKLAITLSVSADLLLFDKNERDPDEELRLQFEAVTHMPEQDKHIVKALLDGMIIKHKTQQMVANISH